MIHVYIVCAFYYTKPTVRTVFQILEKKIEYEASKFADKTVFQFLEKKIAYKASKLADKKFTEAPITTAADDIHKYFSLFQRKYDLMFDARQRIHVKHQVLFSSKDKSKKLKCRLLKFLFGALRVKNR